MLSFVMYSIIRVQYITPINIPLEYPCQKHSSPNLKFLLQIVCYLGYSMTAPYLLPKEAVKKFQNLEIFQISSTQIIQLGKGNRNYILNNLFIRYLKCKCIKTRNAVWSFILSAQKCKLSRKTRETIFFQLQFWFSFFDAFSHFSPQYLVSNRPNTECECIMGSRYLTFQNKTYHYTGNKIHNNTTTFDM